jgi:hypothetical protein
MLAQAIVVLLCIPIVPGLLFGFCWYLDTDANDRENTAEGYRLLDEYFSKKNNNQ